MNLIDWAARWNPVPAEPPCRVWLPAQRQASSAGQQAQASGRTAPRAITIHLSPQQADDLPLWLPQLLAGHDVRPGDRVTVELAHLARVHVTGLALLMTALWRRVGSDGEVLLTGGTRGLRAQLRSLDVTPVSCRGAVYSRPSPSGGDGTPAPSLAGWDPRRLAPFIPQQPRRERGGSRTRVPLAAR